MELQCIMPTTGRWAMQLDFGTEPVASTLEGTPATDPTSDSWWTIGRDDIFIVVCVLIVFWLFNR